MKGVFNLKGFASPQGGSANKSTRHYFIKIAVPAFFLTTVVLTAVHYVEFSVDMRLLKAKEVSRIDIGSESIHRQFKAITSDLRYLATSGYLNNFLTTKSRQDKDILAREFLAITRTKGIYDQIRYIDNTGKEVVRTNKNVDSPYIVSDEDLQNKSGRYYFRDTMDISCREVFVSPLDLNIENKKIERPLKPMIRFGMPACDELGEKQGVVLLNYLGSKMLNNLTEMLGEAQSRTMLLNNDSFWLLSPDPSDEWGFMFGKENRFYNRYPDSWASFLSEGAGQVQTGDGIFTFKTIYPLEEGQASSMGEMNNASLRLIESRNYFWILVLHVPQQRILEEINRHAAQMGIQLAAIACIMVPLTWLYGRERMRANTADELVSRSEEFTQAVTDQIGEGLVVLDFNKQIVMINPKGQSILGWRESHLLGASIDAIIPEFIGDGDDCMLTKCMREEVCQKVDSLYVGRKSGENIPVSVTISPLFIHSRLAGTILTFQDITERLEHEDKLREIALHDPLTGAKNRGEIENILESEIERGRRYGNSCSVLLFDIDKFKAVNDSFGHPYGDKVIKTLCNTIGANLRSSDSIGRYGGEEFVVVLPETGCAQSELFANRLREAVRRIPFSYKNEHVKVTVSIGVASFPDSGNSLTEIIKKADKALYRAKQNGRDCVAVAD
ncbi:MAG: sensor domain-containing diguanylate cyclase [Desulfobacterales bacterium]|nr:sensor domain-containing diguanylate cyclase [Desulfobacterales bacterium]